MIKFKGIIPSQLVEAIRNHRCVVFVGAGMSRQTADAAHVPPGWRELLMSMITWSISNRVEVRGKPEEYRELLDRGRYLIVAEELQSQLGQRFQTCVRDCLDADNLRPGEAHRGLSRIPWVAVVTSNYDSLIEGGYAVAHDGFVPSVFVQNETGLALDSLRSGRFFIFKAHGDLNIAGSIVLGSRDYGRLLYLDGKYRSFLEILFASYTVLFIGFGGDD